MTEWKIPKANLNFSEYTEERMLRFIQGGICEMSVRKLGGCSGITCSQCILSLENDNLKEFKEWLQNNMK